MPSFIETDLKAKAAFDAISRAYEAKHIWNTDIKDHKYYLDRAYDDAIKAARDVMLKLAWASNEANPHRDRRNCPYWQALDYTGFGYVSAASNLRLLNKIKDMPEDGQAALADIIAVHATAKGVWELLKALKPYVIKGRKPSENPRKTPPRTIEHTGTCAVCGWNIKMEADGGLYHHGFNIRWGFRSGKCPGVGYPAWEVSAKGAIAYLNLMEDWLPKKLAMLAGLPKEDGLDDREARAHRRQLESEISQLRYSIKSFTEKLKGWKLEPLPEERERLLNQKQGA